MLVVGLVAGRVAVVLGRVSLLVVVVAQLLPPAYTRLILLVPGQHLLGSSTHNFGRVVVVDPLGGARFVVVTQLLPAVSRLRMVLPGQHPGGVEQSIAPTLVKVPRNTK